ncbi:MAG TPA: hypothetical protein EYQ22_16330 [Gammaproteobacteria bacterium]|nr:hypothetical protein [Gammaproteobacteria bacterium]HIK68654.1 hypothetical protein [Pseudomonadales bacterium]
MKYLVMVIAIFLSGCTTLSKNVQLVSEGTTQSEIVIYRASAFQAGAVSMYLGEKNRYFIELQNNQYAKFMIDSGNHLFQAKANASPASELYLETKPNVKYCLTVEPNPDMLGAVIIPLIANMVPTFIVKDTSCPGDEFLKDYQQVFNT